MPTTIVAHFASPELWPLTSGRTFRVLFDALLGEFADAPVYADISALALFTRAHWLKRLVRSPEIHGKLVYGSNFPVPPTPLAFVWQLGWRVRAIKKMASWVDRDVAVKETLGFGDMAFTRSGDLLGHRIGVGDALAGAV